MAPKIKCSSINSLNIAIVINKSIDRIMLQVKNKKNEPSHIRFNRIEVFDGNEWLALSASYIQEINYSSKATKIKGSTNKIHNFSTKKERNPWIEIKLKESMCIRELRIFNRKNFHENELSKLIIKTSLLEKENFKKRLSKQYDNIQLINEYLKNKIKDYRNNDAKDAISFACNFQKLLGKDALYLHHYLLYFIKKAFHKNEKRFFRIEIARLIYSAFDDLPFMVFKYIVITLIISGKKSEANDLLVKYSRSLDEDNIKDLNACLDNILHNKKNALKITSHGISNHSLKDIDSIKLVRLLNEVFKIFDDKNYLLVACYGTLLGIHREKDFIEHDDDLDLLLVTEEEIIINDILEKVKQNIDELGYKAVIKEKNHASFLQIFPNHIKTHVDIFIGFVKEDKVSLPMENVIPRKIDKNILLPRKKIKFMDEDIYIPNHTERFLEERYGYDWRIPNTVFRHQENKVRQEQFCNIKFSKIDWLKIAIYNKVLGFIQ